MQMQLPREGVEALSEARLAGDEPEVLHGQARPGGLLAAALPPAPRPIVLPVISPL